VAGQGYEKLSMPFNTLANFLHLQTVGILCATWGSPRW